MKETLERLEKEHGLTAFLWAVHGVVDEKGQRYSEIEVKLAECAEAAQDMEG